MNTKNPVFLIVLLLVVAGLSFFGGMKYQENKQPTFAGQQFDRGQNPRNTTRQGQGNRMGFRPVNGEILSSDDKSITVKLTDGSSKIVFISDKTVINKADKVTKSELKSGVKVQVFGQENSDGSVSAQNIQLNPMERNIPRNNTIK